VGIRYNVIRVYPLFWWTKSKTITIFGLKFSTEERLAVCTLRVNALNTNRSGVPQKRIDAKCEQNAIQSVKHRIRKHRHQKVQHSHQCSSN